MKINPFKEYLDYPKNETEEKWQLVGFFQAFLVFFIIGMPLLLLSGQIRNVTELSTYWFVLMAVMVGWPLSCLVWLKYLIRLSHNFGVAMYMSSQKSSKKKVQSNHKQETEANKQ
jgi:hypothetical protein